MAQKICPTCGVVFERKYNRQVYCSIDCKPKKRLIIGDKKCLVCGKEFEIASSNPDKKFCGLECRRNGRPYKKTCIICEKVFMANNSLAQYCSKDCSRYNPKDIKFCKYCGNKFYNRKDKDTEYCSLDCRNHDATVETEIGHCQYCGKEMKIYPHHKTHHRGKYCSVKCQIIGGSSNTDIELMVKEWLDLHNVKYIFQYNFGKYYPDFYIVDANIFLEVQGDYWHGNPEIYKLEDLNSQQIDHMNRDKRKFGYYKKYRMKFYELWGKDIKNDLNSLMTTIKELA
ncbi:MAG: hypothetical protein K0Q53_70 [Massilibacillus sp.]|nr:hypothetical protein [Massilibacillus sp.]